ncbi:MAG: ABC transporter transmembrane domain-containing protein, partial [Bacteriovoracaceae bacterium]
MNDFSFIKFLKDVIAKKRWSYIGGVISVIILDAVDMLPALIIKEITDNVQTNPQEFEVLPYSLALVGCYILISLLRLAWRFLIMIPSRYIEQDLRQKAYDKLLSSNFIQTSHLKTGDVVSTLSQDLSNIRMFMGPGILVFFDSLAYIVFIPATLFYILGTGALWVLLPFTLLVLVVAIVHRPFEKGFTEISEELGGLSQFVYEETQGVRFFRAEGLIQMRRHKYDILLKSLLGKQLNVSKWELGLDGTLQLVLQSSYFAVLVLAWQGHGPMAQGLGALTVAIQLLDKLTWPLMSIGYLMNLFQQARTGAKRLHAINSLHDKKMGHEKVSGEIKNIKINQLNVNSIDGVNLLSDINLEIRNGEHIALVGAVGSGKTVL